MKLQNFNQNEKKDKKENPVPPGTPKRPKIKEPNKKNPPKGDPKKNTTKYS